MPLELDKLLEEIIPLNIEQEQDLNIFDVGAKGYLETPTSDMIAFYLGGQPKSPDWLVRPFRECLAHCDPCYTGDDAAPVLDSFIIHREFACFDESEAAPKFIDIVLEGDSLVVGIENKVLASTANNPFDVYSRALERLADGRKVVKVILAANKSRIAAPAGWAVMGYDDIASAALRFMGEVTQTHPFGKWHVFYIEFVQHLQNLSQGRETGTMSDEARRFAETNLSGLRKAQELLQSFEEDLQSEAEETLHSVLTTDQIRRAASDWKDGNRALRYFPKSWPDGSEVILAFVPAETMDGAGCVEYSLYAYFLVPKARKREATTFADAFKVEAVSRRHSWYVTQEDVNDGSAVWYWGREKQWLGIGAWAKGNGREGALAAFKDMAAWIDRNGVTGLSCQ